MSELRKQLRLYKEENGLSIRQLADSIGISKTAADEIMKEEERKLDLVTLTKIAKTLNRPLWQIIEMAGFQAGLDETQEMARKLALAAQEPEVREIIDLLLNADPHDRQAVLNYLTVRNREAKTNR